MNTSHISSSKHLINAQVINSPGSLGSGFYCLSSGSGEISVLRSSIIFPGPWSELRVVSELHWHALSFWPGGLLFPGRWAGEWEQPGSGGVAILEDGVLPFSENFGNWALEGCKNMGTPLDLSCFLMFQV